MPTSDLLEQTTALSSCNERTINRRGRTMESLVDELKSAALFKRQKEAINELEKPLDLTVDLVCFMLNFFKF